MLSFDDDFNSHLKIPRLAFAVSILALFFGNAIHLRADTLELHGRNLFEGSITHNLRLTPDEGNVELEVGQLYEHKYV